MSSSSRRARRPASHALAAAICSSGGLVSSPSLSFAASSANAGVGKLADPMPGSARVLPHQIGELVIQTEAYDLKLTVIPNPCC